MHVEHERAQLRRRLRRAVDRVRDVVKFQVKKDLHAQTLREFHDLRAEPRKRLFADFHHADDRANLLDQTLRVAKR